jgi:hypothetical protein
MPATLEQNEWDALRTRGLTGTRALPMAPESIREADRSFGCVASTETPARMIDYETYTFVDEVLLARGGEFPDTVPLLRNHRRFELEDVIGSAREWRLEADANQWAARGYIATPANERDGVDVYWSRVKDGHLRAVSIGYEVYEFEDIEPGQRKKVAGRFWTAGVRRLRISTKWRGHELSLTPIGADSKALIRSTDQRPAPIANWFRTGGPQLQGDIFR